MACTGVSKTSGNVGGGTHIDNAESPLSDEETTIKTNLKTFFTYIASNLRWPDVILFKHFTNRDHLRFKEITANEMVEEMLDFILNMKIPGRFCDFVDHLKHSGNSKVVTILKGKNVPKNDNSRKLLEKCLPVICDQVLVTEILPELKAMEAIGHEDCAVIYNMFDRYGNWRATFELMLMLPNKNQNWFDILVDALNNANNSEVVFKLRTGCEFINNGSYDDEIDRRSVCTLNSESEIDSAFGDNLHHRHSSVKVKTSQEYSMNTLNKINQRLISIEHNQEKTNALVQHLSGQINRLQQRPPVQESTKRLRKCKANFQDTSGNKRRTVAPAKFARCKLRKNKERELRSISEDFEEYTANVEITPKLDDSGSTSSQTLYDSDKRFKHPIKQMEQNEPMVCEERYNQSLNTGLVLKDQLTSVNKRIKPAVSQQTKKADNFTIRNNDPYVDRHLQFIRVPEDFTMEKAKSEETATNKLGSNEPFGSCYISSVVTMPPSHIQIEVTNTDITTADIKKVGITDGDKKFQEGDTNYGERTPKLENDIASSSNYKTTLDENITNVRECNSLIGDFGNVFETDPKIPDATQSPLLLSCSSGNIGDKRAVSGVTKVDTYHEMFSEIADTCHNEDRDAHMTRIYSIQDKSQRGLGEKCSHGSERGFSSCIKNQGFLYPKSTGVCEVSEKNATQNETWNVDDFESVEILKQKQKLGDASNGSVESYGNTHISGLQDSRMCAEETECLSQTVDMASGISEDCTKTDLKTCDQCLLPALVISGDILNASVPQSKYAITFATSKITASRPIVDTTGIKLGLRIREEKRKKKRIRKCSSAVYVKTFYPL